MDPPWVFGRDSRPGPAARGSSTLGDLSDESGIEETSEGMSCEDRRGAMAEPWGCQRLMPSPRLIGARRRSRYATSVAAIAVINSGPGRRRR
jgi:hypothetical protein